MSGINKPYRILRYSDTDLPSLFAQAASVDESTITGRGHSTYFREYFRELGARSVIVESDYVDRDFLEDYAGYYVRCFTPYDRHCTRFHFLSCDVSPSSFKKYLSTGKGTSLQKRMRDSYLGFVVIKPLPRTIIGRTCLKNEYRHLMADAHWSANSARRKRGQRIALGVLAVGWIMLSGIGAWLGLIGAVPNWMLYTAPLFPAYVIGAVMMLAKLMLIVVGGTASFPIGVYQAEREANKTKTEAACVSAGVNILSLLVLALYLRWVPWIA